MTTRYLLVLFLIFAPASLSWGQSRKQPLYFAFLRTVAAGDFPVEHWSTESEDQCDASIEAAKKVFRLVKELAPDDEARISDAFESRTGALRWSGAAPSIDLVLQKHSDLLKVVKTIRFPEMRSQLGEISFEEISSVKLEAFWQLIVIATVDSAVRNDFDLASNVLAGGFAASRWLQHADAYQIILRALLLEERLHCGFVDLQAIGAPILDGVISELHDGIFPDEKLDQAIWDTLCEDFPIFRTRDRKSRDWEVDLQTTLISFGVPGESGAQLLSELDIETVGQRLQREATKRLRVLDIDIVAGSSDMRSEAVKESRDSHKTVENRIASIVSSSFDKVLVKPIELSRMLSMNARQRLLAIKCGEVIRKESRKKGQWISEIDKLLSDSFPQDPLTGLPFDVQAHVFDPFKFPYYIVPLASPGSAEDAIHVEFATQARYGAEDR